MTSKLETGELETEEITILDYPTILTQTISTLEEGSSEEMETSQCVPRWETEESCDEVAEPRWEKGGIVKPIPKPFSPPEPAPSVTATGTLEAVVGEAARGPASPHGGAHLLPVRARAADALVPSCDWAGPGWGHCASLGSAAAPSAAGDRGGGFTTTASASASQEDTDNASSGGGGRGTPLAVGVDREARHFLHKVDREKEEEEDEDDEEEEKGRPPVSGRERRRAAAVHNMSERRRRDRINEKMRTLQKMVPNSSKIDKASLLDEVIAYVKLLQAQIQMMSRMNNIPSAMMMPMYMQHQHLQMSSMAHMAQLSQMVQMGMAMAMATVDPLGRPAMPAACLPICSPANLWMQNNGSMMQQPMGVDAYAKMAALYQQLYLQSTGQQPQYPV